MSSQKIEFSDSRITSLLLDEAFELLKSHLQNDVVVVGAGPAGLAVSYFLAKNGLKVLVLERRLSVGGGMNGGGMLLPGAVIQKSRASLLQEVGVKMRDRGDFFTFSPVEAGVKLASAVIDSGVKIVPGIEVEDVIERDGRVAGVVTNWVAIKMAGLHVDPLMIESRFVVDATGHDASVASLAGVSVPGNGPMNAPLGEEEVIEKTSFVKPGLLVVGMAACAVTGTHRMGPVFGGMFESARKGAELILKEFGA